MTSALGDLSLAGAMFLAAAALLAALHAGRTASAAAARCAAALIAGYLLFISIASGILFNALIASDFHLQYVVSYTERALPVGYKIAAFWAGQEGSLLLWAWLLGVVATFAAVQLRKSLGSAYPWTLAVLAFICLFFGTLMYFAANPFVASPTHVHDGHGLNPLLQDPGMIAHPPLLFAGYAGFAVPFAILIGALLSGRTDDAWVQPIRRWLLASWLLLGVGIVLGANWAYTELGWGGYWAWDPVENASLLPWLTATALLHSLHAQQTRGTFRIWNAGLISASFLLCIVGTYITRSGVIQSVHAFGASNIGIFFFGFLILNVLLVLGVGLGRLIADNIAHRPYVLLDKHPLDGLLSREGAFLLINMLLTVIMLITLGATIYPALSTLAFGRAVEIKPSFYNTVINPLAMVVVALMSIGPLLSGGKNAGPVLRQRLVVPALITLIVVFPLALSIRTDDLWPQSVAVAPMTSASVLKDIIWSLLTVAVGTFTIAAILTDMVIATRRQLAEHPANPAVALVRVLDGNHRRYGAQLAHLGLVLLVAGVVGSSIFTRKENITLRPGQSAQVAGYNFTLETLGEKRAANYTAVAAHLTLTDAAGRESSLHPQIRYYDKTEQPNTEIALHVTWLRDVYVTLAGWKSGNTQEAVATFQIIINPLLVWIWIGGLVTTLGGLYAMLPSLLAPPAPRVLNSKMNQA